MDKRLTWYILLGMVLGVIAGYLVYTFIPSGEVHVWPFGVEADLKKMMMGKRAGADDFLLKPFDRKILTQVFGNLSAAA